MSRPTSFCVLVASRLVLAASVVALGGDGLAGEVGAPTEERGASETTPSDPKPAEPVPDAAASKDEPKVACPEAPPEESDETAFQVESGDGKLVIKTGSGEPVATYVYADEQILRPYFMQVHAPGETPVTRHSPPREGMELTDHATMHPGIWLGFGDLSGADFWRNKARVEHVEFVAPPVVKDGVLSFTVRNRYVSGEKTVCNEVCRHTVRRVDHGFLLTYDSTFSDEKPFVFGDQEEMGLGIRVAAPLRVRSGGGSIVNAEGMTNEEAVWGKTSEYCSYGAVVDGRRIGLLIAPHPENFRKSWFHARDYGFLAANPFGRKSFMAGDASKVTVKPGETLRLRYGIVAYSAPEGQPFDPSAHAKRYVGCVAPPATEPVDSVDSPATTDSNPQPSKGTTTGGESENPTTENPTTESQAEKSAG